MQKGVPLESLRFGNRVKFSLITGTAPNTVFDRFRLPTGACRVSVLYCRIISGILVIGRLESNNHN